MKLRLSTSIRPRARAFAVLTALAACGCSAGTQVSQPAAVPVSSAHVSAGPGVAAETAAAGTTQLMFAELSTARPAPKVGKAHLVLGEDLEGTSASEPSTDADELRAPKEARRSDGSRRGGHFGTTK